MRCPKAIFIVYGRGEQGNLRTFKNFPSWCPRKKVRKGIELNPLSTEKALCVVSRGCRLPSWILSVNKADAVVG